MPSAAIHTTIPLYICICTSCSEFMFHVYSMYTYICKKLPRFQMVCGFLFSPKYVAGCHVNDPHQKWMPPDDVHGNFLQIAYMIAGRRIRVGREGNNIRQGEAEPSIIPYPFQPISSSLLPCKRYRPVCIYMYVCTHFCIHICSMHVYLLQLL